jgi:hypothetical protein
LGARLLRYTYLEKSYNAAVSTKSWEITQRKTFIFINKYLGTYLGTPEMDGLLLVSYRWADYQLTLAFDQSIIDSLKVPTYSLCHRTPILLVSLIRCVIRHNTSHLCRCWVNTKTPERNKLKICIEIFAIKKRVFFINAMVWIEPRTLCRAGKACYHLDNHVTTFYLNQRRVTVKSVK